MDSYLNYDNFMNSGLTTNTTNTEDSEFRTPGETTSVNLRRSVSSFSADHFQNGEYLGLDVSICMLYAYYEKKTKLGRLEPMNIVQGKPFLPVVTFSFS